MKDDCRVFTTFWLLTITINKVCLRCVIHVVKIQKLTFVLGLEKEKESKSLPGFFFANLRKSSKFKTRKKFITRGNTGNGALSWLMQCVSCRTTYTTIWYLVIGEQNCYDSVTRRIYIGALSDHKIKFHELFNNQMPMIKFSCGSEDRGIESVRDSACLPWYHD